MAAVNRTGPTDMQTLDPLADCTVIPGTGTARQALPDVTRFDNGADSMKGGVGGHDVGSTPGTARVKITDAQVRAFDNGASGNQKA